MRPLARRATAVRLAALALALALAAAACGTAAATPTPTATPPPPTPVIATPTPPPAAATGYWLRLTTSQAIPPLDRYGAWPVAIVTADGRLLVQGAVPAIYPGPLVMPVFARQVSDAGRETIVGWAKDLGLLDGRTDFTGDNALPGGMIGTIELTVDGRPVVLTGVPDVQGPGDPGSPEAFAELWRRIANLQETLPGQLGPEQPWAPDGYAILVGPPPVPEGGMQAHLADWPLDAPLASFGTEVASGRRCGLVVGDDAATLRPALEGANQLTQWVQDPDTSATFGLTVRPMVAGEDPCRDAFGTS